MFGIDFGNYNKFFGAIIGNIVGALIAWAAVNVPAITECTAADVCTVLGLSQAQITGVILGLVNSFSVWKAQPNR